MLVAMMTAFELILRALVGLFRSKAALQAEVLILRNQLNILRRKSRKRFVITGADRLGFCRPLLPRSPCDGCAGEHSAGNGDPVAPCRISPLLALQIATWHWTAKGRSEDTQVDP
jgi:hypothetical protein